MFISKRKIILSKIVAILLLIFSAPWIFIGIIGLGLSISKLAENASVADGREDLSVAFGILVFLAFWLHGRLCYSGGLELQHISIRFLNWMRMGFSLWKNWLLLLENLRMQLQSRFKRCSSVAT